MPKPLTSTAARTKPATAITAAVVPPTTRRYARPSRLRREGGPPPVGESPTPGTLPEQPPVEAGRGVDVEDAGGAVERVGERVLDARGHEHERSRGRAHLVVA